jgi:predicted branched-subunit amino acid permease
MAFAKNIGKKKKSLIYMGGMSIFVYLGSSQIINDTPPF